MDSGSVARLLQDWRRGDERAYDRLIPFVYGELRRLARAQLRRDPAGQSLQPTALVHEAYLRLVKADVDWRDRTHFLSVAARVEHAYRARSPWMFFIRGFPRFYAIEGLASDTRFQELCGRVLPKPTES